jgi:hypothetical protein
MKQMIMLMAVAAGVTVFFLFVSVYPLAEAPRFPDCVEADLESARILCEGLAGVEQGDEYKRHEKYKKWSV